MFEKFGVSETRSTKPSSAKVWLACGGYIVIDETEALISIDVEHRA